MDIIIFLILIIIVLILFRDSRVIIFFIGTSDVVLRLIHFIKDQLAISEFSSFVNKYVPTSVYGIIQRSTSGIVTTLLACSLSTRLSAILSAASAFFLSPAVTALFKSFIADLTLAENSLFNLAFFLSPLTFLMAFFIFGIISPPTHNNPLHFNKKVE